MERPESIDCAKAILQNFRLEPPAAAARNLINLFNNFTVKLQNEMAIYD